MKALSSRVGALWCQWMHPAPMWPVNGHYHCPVCLREFPVLWEQDACSTNSAHESAAPRVDGRQAAIATASSR